MRELVNNHLQHYTMTAKFEHGNLIWTLNGNARRSEPLMFMSENREQLATEAGEQRVDAYY